MTDSFPLKITLSAIDRATAPLARAQAKIASIFAPFQRIGARLRLLSDTAGIPKILGRVGGLATALGGVGREVSRLAFRFGTLGVAGGAAALALVRQYGEAGDEIAKTARKLGIAVETLQELRFAASREGIDTGAFDKGLELFTRTIGEAALGLGEGRVALDALGVSVKDAEGKVRPFDELLDELADKLSSVSDQNLRNALAAKLFGRSGVEMNKLVQLGSKAIADLRGEARRLGLVMSRDATDAAEDFSDAQDDLFASLRGVRNILGGAVLPLVTEFAKKATDYFVQLQPKAREFTARFLERLPERLATVQRSFGDLVDEARPFLDFAEKIVRRLGPAKSILLALAVVLGGPLVLALGQVLAAVLALSTALLTTPIGLTITAIAGLAALLISNWESVGPFFEELWKGVREAAEAFFDWINPKLEFVADKVFGIKADADSRPGEVPDQFRRTTAETDRATWRAMREGTAAFDGERARLDRLPDARQPSAVAPEARVTVEFRNAPPGTRVRKEGARGLDLDLDLGFMLDGARAW